MKLSIVSKQPGICQLQTITKTTMADNSGSRRCTSKKVTKSSDSIAELDIYSEKFDPLAFLLSEQAKIPRPDAKVFDNLAKWQSHHQQKSRQDVEKKKTPGKSDLPARRWLPHQLPVDTRRPQRSPRNVLTKIQTIQGPLALLRKFMEEKTRIKEQLDRRKRNNKKNRVQPSSTNERTKVEIYRNTQIIVVRLLFSAISRRNLRQGSALG
ncbi:U7 snRNA-associated Sm-like protein LSm11 isoform X3 [Euwallacea fornicatus]|uniref:U7 snRNA-associated Sm-like protein LSm11 isoform X3 n=1 Tax=Euwallacea fornicatus TaxID=995702 RepID=UPI00338F0A6F